MSGRRSAAAPKAEAEPPARGRRAAAEAADNRIVAAAAGPSKAELAAERRNSRLPAKSAKPALKAKSAKRQRSPSPESGESAAESSSDEEEGEEAASPPAANEGRPAKKKAKPIAVPSDGGAEITCRACTITFAAEAVVDKYYCPCCQLIYTVAGDAHANTLRLALLQNAATAAAAAASTPSASTGSSSVTSGQLAETNSAKQKLGAYEAELKRLLDAAGDPLARFQEAAGISHTDAIAGMRQSAYNGASYQLQSQHLTNLIRSGNFRELTLALPVTNEEALRRRTAEAKGSKVRISHDGELTSTADSMVERPLTSLQEFLKIVIVTILPTLFDRPRAALDWLELSRSVINIAESDDGWQVALPYLTNLLADRIPRRVPFNDIDLDLLRTMRAVSGAPRYGGAAAAAGRTGEIRPGGSARPEWVDYCKKDVCREWNVGNGCKAPPGTCRYAHTCCWIGCQEQHQGRDCRLRPAGVTFRGRDSGDQRRQQRGGKGKGRPPAAGGRQ